MNWIEGFGYLASVLVALSLMMSSIVRLRWVNLVGAGMFSAYGFLIGALPVALLNGFIVLVNIYHLLGIYRRQNRFHLVDAKLDDPLVQHWLASHRQDIMRHFGDLQLAGVPDAVCTLLLRNSEPAGLVFGRQQEQTFELLMDYAFPRYRDLKHGRYLYGRSGFFAARNIRRITTRSGSAAHQAYLLRMGFTRLPGEPDCFQYLLDRSAA
jgi:hypothetical protein